MVQHSFSNFSNFQSIFFTKNIYAIYQYDFTNYKVRKIVIVLLFVHLI